jgi:hypothetical protein
MRIVHRCCDGSLDGPLPRPYGRAGSERVHELPDVVPGLRPTQRSDRPSSIRRALRRAIRVSGAGRSEGDEIPGYAPLPLRSDRHAGPADRVEVAPSTFIAPDGLIAANAIFGVSANGRVIPDDVGEGRVEAPDTLAGWYAAIARIPDTSIVTSAEEAASVNGSRQPPILLLIAVAVLEVVATLRRLASNRVVVDPPRR